MSRASLDALLADADALASRLAAGDPTDARDVVKALAECVRALRDERDEALGKLGEAALARDGALAEARRLRPLAHEHEEAAAKAAREYDEAIADYIRVAVEGGACGQTEWIRVRETADALRALVGEEKP